MSVKHLSGIRTEAKRIRRYHPNMSYKAALKQASKEYHEDKAYKKRQKELERASRKKKVSGTRRKKTRARTVGKVAHHKPRVRRNKPKSVTAREIHEVKRVGAISYTGGKVKISGTADVEAAKRQLRAKLGEQAGWLDVAISSAKTKAEKNRLRKKKREIIAELNRIK